MENKKILIDTSIIIGHIRKKQKDKTLLYYFFQNEFEIYISTVTTFEIYNGINQENIKLVDTLFSRLIPISLDNQIAKYSSIIYNKLKNENKIIEIRDIFIAATAIIKNLPLSTLNTKHFNRIENIILWE
jgi:tRNA(fMet)-specific endonuclease VapC